MDMSVFQRLESLSGDYKVLKLELIAAHREAGGIFTAARQRIAEDKAETSAKLETLRGEPVILAGAQRSADWMRWRSKNLQDAVTPQRRRGLPHLMRKFQKQKPLPRNL